MTRKSLSCLSKDLQLPNRLVLIRRSTVLDFSRENAKREQVKASVSNELEPYALELLEVLMNAAKAVQETSREL